MECNLVFTVACVHGCFSIQANRTPIKCPPVSGHASGVNATSGPCTDLIISDTHPPCSVKDSLEFQSAQVASPVGIESTDENTVLEPISTAPIPIRQDQLVFSTSGSGVLTLQQNSNHVRYATLL